jgi:CHAT domain-containing protein/Tfp pilus assembly protein PilF
VPTSASSRETQRLLRPFALGMLLSATIVPAAPAQIIVERELIGGQSHSFEVVAQAGQFVRALLVERGADLIETISGPDGRTLLESDRSNQTHGLERISLIAPTTGSYIVTVRASAPDAPRARYELRLDAVRFPSAEDCLRLEAESALLEGDRLEQKDSAACLKQASLQYRRAVELADLLGDYVLKSEALISLGSTHWSQGELRASVDLFDDAAASARAVDDPALEASALFYLGSVYGLLGETGSSFHKLRSALQIYRDLGDIRLQGVTVNALAIRFKDMGENARALALYTEALSLARASGDIRSQPVALNNIGNIYYDRGSWQEALQYFQQALPIWRETKNRRGEAASLYNIGLIYHEQGELQRALPFFRQALTLTRESGNRPGEAMSLYRLGLAAEDLDELDQALAYLNNALEIYRATGDRRRQAIALTCLGRIYARRGEFDKSFDHYGRALPLSRAMAYRYGEAFTLKHRADAQAACGATSSALQDYVDALAGFQSIGHQVWRARTLVAMAETLASADRVTEAHETIEEALAVIEQLQTNVTSPELKAAYLASVRKGYELSIDLLMRMHAADPSKRFDEAALHVSERARARSFLDLLKESGSDVRRGIASELLQRQRELRQRLTARIEREVRLTESNPKGAASETAAIELAALTDELEQIERKIRASNPHYAASTDSLLHAREIQQLLDRETVLLEYALGERRSYLWVISRDAVTSYVLPPRGVIEPVARRLLELLKDRAAARNAALISETSRNLTGMLLRSAADRLEARRLVIVSDGILHYIPFAALPLWTDDRTPLIDRFELINVPSASTLAALRQQLASRPSPPKVLVVLADPVFRHDDPRAPSQTVAARQGKSGSLARLPFTRREARAILAFVPPSARKEAFDFEASRATALSSELAQYRIVHFATHGFFNTEHPELSGLVLSLVDKNGEDQEGFILTSDVFGMTLNADLVVLSGCRTALGREVHGEGITGLSRAFLFAGAARVAASLWKVDDAATAELMIHFYRGLLVDKLPAVAALRAAQARLRRDSRWSSPYYWAGFVLQGDWK